MYIVWVTSYYTDVFPYHTPLEHSAFSMSKGTVTTDTTNVTYAHVISHVQEISLVVKAACACGTHAIHACHDNM